MLEEDRVWLKKEDSILRNYVGEEEMEWLWKRARWWMPMRVTVTAWYLYGKPLSGFSILKRHNERHQEKINTAKQ